MSFLIRPEYNPVMQVHKTALRCGKCGLCRFIDNTKIQDINFSYICPSGARFKFEEYWASGKSELARGLITQLGATTYELDFNDRFLHALYTCTLCAGCQKICEPIGKEPLKTIVALREKAVLDGAAPLDKQQKLIDNILQYDNPWAEPKEIRDAWAKNLRIKDINVANAEVLFFVGCLSFNANTNRAAVSAAKILQKADIDFGIMGNLEPCCGSAMLRIGDRKNFEIYAAENIKKLNKFGFKTLVTTCAGCFNILRDEYPDIAELNFDILHISEFILQLIENGKLKLTKDISSVNKIFANKKFTYHDPCTLGRFSNVYKDPRELLMNVLGLSYIEMYRNKENSWCCGAGCAGEVKTQYPDFAEWTANERIKEAKNIGADIIVTSCPFCENNLTISENDIKVFDLVEIIETAL